MGKDNTGKKFDCVEMKRKIQAEIYEETKNMTPQEETEYYRKSVESGPFAEKVAKIRSRQAKRKKAG